MDKKGTEPLLWILIEAAVITVTIIIVFQYISTVQQNEVFQKQYLARDVALMVNTVSTVPGDVSYTYVDSKANLSKYTFSFGKNHAQVRLGEQVDMSEYPFYYDSSLAANFREVKDSQQLGYGKTGGSLEVGKEVTLKFMSTCPTLVTTGAIPLLTLDPADQRAWQVVEYIKQKSLVPVTLTRDATLKSDDERLAKISVDAVAVVSLQYSESGYVRISYSTTNQQKSEKLACLLKKNVEKLQVPVVSIPSSDRLISKNTKGIGIRLDIGVSMTIENAANVIASAVREYNG